MLGTLTTYITGNNGANFFATASLVSTNNFPNSKIAIRQVDAVTYQIFYQTAVAPGKGIFTVNTMNTFTYSGTSTTPSGVS